MFTQNLINHRYFTPLFDVENYTRILCTVHKTVALMTLFDRKIILTDVVNIIYFKFGLHGNICR